MSRKRCRWLFAAILLAISGCAMCSNCDDYSYTGSGGVWERLDPCFGRVGSAFTPEVGTRVDEMGIESVEPGMASPSDQGEPTPADERTQSNEPTPADDAAPAPPPDDSAEAPETSVLQPREIFVR